MQGFGGDSECGLPAACPRLGGRPRGQDLVLVRKQQLEQTVDGPVHAEQFGAGAQARSWRRRVEHLFDRPGQSGISPTDTSGPKRP
jgi:hypothetical protein